MNAVSSVGSALEAMEIPAPDISAAPLDRPKPQLPPKCGQIFEAERYLGGGAYGEVWLARHRGSGERVALKIPRSGAPVEPDLVRRFLNEARVTAQLDCPRVVRVRAHGLENGVPWIAYEYLGDVTVHRRLNREGRLTPTAALRIGSQVAAALEAAHARGVIHRDLKPANIIEVAPGEYKVLDFGLAYGRRPYAMQTGSHLIVGTPAYMAPEQVKGDPASESSDQFGLGLVLYQLLTGEIPQHDDDVGTLLRRRSREPIASLNAARPGLPARVVGVVDRMLSPDPLARYKNLREVRQAIEQILASLDSATSNRRTALSRSRPPARRTGRTRSVAALAPPPARANALRAGSSLAPFLVAPLMIIATAIICWLQM